MHMSCLVHPIENTKTFDIFKETEVSRFPQKCIFRQLITDFENFT